MEESLDMRDDPLLGNPHDPLISVLIFNYEGRLLRECLESIFNQDMLQNVEVIYLDDATTDGSWNVAVEYAEKYGARMTIGRNLQVRGPRINAEICRDLSRGRYLARLTGDQAFDPDYIRTCARIRERDPQADFASLRQVIDRSPRLPPDEMVPPSYRCVDSTENKLPRNVPTPEVVPPPPSVAGGPLVSILCYNYNYGRYLRRTLSSLFAQTYRNIEVCFSDNGSTDDSWKIATEFERRYHGKMHLVRHRRNFGPDANFANCYRMMQGEYFINFCSDDAMEPEYVERCVGALQAHPHAGMAIVNRAMLDEEDRRTEEPPFYNCSCIIPGHEQAAVYMMAGVNPSTSQIMYRRADIDRRTATGNLAARYYGTRILDFNLSLDYDIVYIKDSLLLHRMHRRSDTSHADRILMPVVGMYVLTHQLAELADLRKARKVTGRLPQALDKLAQQAIRYSVRMLQEGDERVALRYFHLAAAINPHVENDPVWRRLQTCWSAGADAKAVVTESVGRLPNLAARSVSYDPPPGSISL